MCLNTCKSEAINFELFYACHGLAKVEAWDHQERVIRDTAGAQNLVTVVLPLSDCVILGKLLQS